MKIRQTTYVSCYLTPSEKIDEFQEKLDELEDTLRDMEGEILIAGDFNASAVEWGEDRSNSRGTRVMDMISRMDLLVLNTGSTPTFRRPGCRQTIVDITFATRRLAA